MGKTIFRFGFLSAFLGLLLGGIYPIMLYTEYLSSYIAFLCFLFLVLGLFLGKSFVAVKKKGQLSQLTKRENEVLQQLSLGLNNREIAEKLFVSETTIKSHVSSILSKLEAKNRTEVLIKAKFLL